MMFWQYRPRVLAKHDLHDLYLGEPKNAIIEDLRPGYFNFQLQRSLVQFNSDSRTADMHYVALKN